MFDLIRDVNTTRKGDKSKLEFTIESLYDSGSGMKYKSKAEFLNELSLMIDDCAKNGGSFFDAVIDSNASCFCINEE